MNNKIQEETERGKAVNQNAHSAKKLAVVAMFIALAVGTSYVEFPVFPSVPFLKLDFSFAVMLIAAYMFGALSGEVIIVVFTLIKLPFSQTMMVGELANFVMAEFFVVMPSLVYKYRRRLSTVIVSLFVATVIISAVALFTNRFMLFPLYVGDGAAEFFSGVWYFVLCFNLIKGVANSVVAVALYKRLKKILNKYL